MKSIAPPARPVKASKPRPKPQRRISLLCAPTPAMDGICRITVGKDATDYFLRRLPSDFGTAFRLVKLLGEHSRYDVLLNGERSSCECKGFLHHGHCKHVDGLMALLGRGLL